MEKEDAREFSSAARAIINALRSRNALNRSRSLDPSVEGFRDFGWRNIMFTMSLTGNYML